MNIQRIMERLAVCDTMGGDDFKNRQSDGVSLLLLQKQPK